MTEHNSHPHSGRNKFLTISLLTATAVIGGWITYFLVTFDLNDYRKQAEEQLSSMLSMSVSIGEMSYELHGNNLALHIAGLQVGDQNTQLELSAPELIVDLKWIGLLQRDFSISVINLTDPVVQFRRAAAEISQGTGAPEATPVLIDQALLYNSKIDALEIRNGSLQITAPAADSTSSTVEINEVSGSLRNIRLGSMTQLSLEGKLSLPEQQGSSHWHIQGDAGLRIDETRGLTPELDLDVQSKGFDLPSLGRLVATPDSKLSLSGQTDLNLLIKGEYPEKMDFQVGLASQGIKILPGNLYTSPIEFKHLTASGQLQADNHVTKLNHLALQIDNSRLSGQLEWMNHQEPYTLSADLANSSLSIKQIKQWLPDKGSPWEKLNTQLEDRGSIHLQNAKFHYNQAAQAHDRLIIEQMAGELLDITWPFSQAPTLVIASLPFSLEERNWSISNSHLQMGSMQITVDGHGYYSQDKLHINSFDFDGDILPRKLFEEWYLPQGSLTTDGKIAISGHLEGPHDKLAIDLQADLSHLQLDHPAGLGLSPAKDDKLAIHATLSPEEISLDHGSITWSAAKGHISGSYQLGNLDSLNIDALLSISDLTRIAKKLPLLEKLALNGQADLSITHQGNPDSNLPEMTLTLRDAGLNPTRFIAPIRKINGRVKIEPTGLSAEGLQAQLGESLLTVDARLEDFTNPRLSLDVKGPAVRARDIVFYSDSAVLRDINGHLEIDKRGLSFAPVDVRLDGGTDASVRGTIGFSPPYPVTLDITSDYAVVGEIIGLWVGGSKRDTGESNDDRPAAIRERPQTPIVINARVNNGDLYGMKFSKATGVIKPTSKQLLIHPLDFSVGEGHSNTQVITDFKQNGPSVLRISGHAEEVDALEVYRELLNQKSIIKGKLSGDFYLHGEIGSNFLPSSYGRFNIQVRDGVLHQFPVLSKIFSLLNVSQIFALQLPDMDSEGMPFNKLKANLRLDEGVFTSEDLVIRSEAMNQSYSGQLDIVNDEVNFVTSIHPLGTVDKVVSRIPIAGWLLTGEDRALLTAHFKVTGPRASASVSPLPLDTLTEPTIGLLKRTLGLPFKLVEDPQILWGGKPKGSKEKSSNSKKEKPPEATGPEQ